MPLHRLQLRPDLPLCQPVGNIRNVKNMSSCLRNRRAIILPAQDRAGDALRISHQHVPDWHIFSGSSHLGDFIPFTSNIDQDRRFKRATSCPAVKMSVSNSAAKFASTSGETCGRDLPLWTTDSNCSKTW
jgi:hypothetical protein